MTFSEGDGPEKAMIRQMIYTNDFLGTGKNPWRVRRWHWRETLKPTRPAKYPELLAPRPMGARGRG